MTLKLTEQPEEREKCSWIVPADFRNRNDAKVAVVHTAFEQGAIEFLRFKGESPPEGYKVELPPPRESKKAKRKAADGTGNEGEPHKKPKLLSQAEQFHASTLSSKATEPRASGSGPSRSSRARPSTSAEPIFLPRPGYVDPKPEPGELPSELPTCRPEHPPTSTPRWPTTQPSFNRPTREYPPHPTAESSSSFHHRSRSIEPRGTYYSYDFGYGYGYERDRYTPPPLPRPPVGPGGRGYTDYERSEYDYDYDYTHEGSYSHPTHPYMQHPQPPPQPAESISGPKSAPRRWVPVPAPSPPRVWEPGPRVAEMDAKRGGTCEPRPLSLLSQAGEPSEPPEPSLTRASSEVVVEAGLIVPESTFVSASAPGSASSTPASSNTHAHNTGSVSSKEELLGVLTE